MQYRAYLHEGWAFETTLEHALTRMLTVFEATTAVLTVLMSKQICTSMKTWTEGIIMSTRSSSYGMFVFVYNYKSDSRLVCQCPTHNTQKSHSFTPGLRSDIGHCQSLLSDLGHFQ